MKTNITNDDGSLSEVYITYAGQQYKIIGTRQIEDITKEAMTDEQFWKFKKKGYSLKGALNVIDTLQNIDTGMTIEVTRKALHYSTRQHRKAA